MTEPSLQKAAAVSLLAHLFFFLLVVGATRKATDTSPKVYTVKIVELESKKVKRVVPKDAKLPVPPPKKRPSVQIEKASSKKESPPKPTPPPEKPAKMAVQDTGDKLSKYKSDRLQQLKRQKEAMNYKEERLRELENRRRLENIRRQAASRSSSSDQASADTQSRILDQYAAKIQRSITEAWVFPDIKDISMFEAIVSITVASDGRININSFEKPSGNNLFDRSALKAISKVGRAEPTPFGEPLDIGIRFYPSEK